MESELGVLVGAAGKLARIDPSRFGAGLFGGFPVTFDRDQPEDECQIELTKPDGKFALRAVAANAWLSADATSFAEDLSKQFGTRPLDARGGYESWTIVTLPSGLVIAFIEYDHNGRRFCSAPLTWVRS